MMIIQKTMITKKWNGNNILFKDEYYPNLESVINEVHEIFSKSILDYVQNQENYADGVRKWFQEKSLNIINTVPVFPELDIYLLLENFWTDVDEEGNYPQPSKKLLKAVEKVNKLLKHEDYQLFQDFGERIDMIELAEAYVAQFPTAKIAE
jgi:hypothetical protein